MNSISHIFNKSTIGGTLCLTALGGAMALLGVPLTVAVPFTAAAVATHVLRQNKNNDNVNHRPTDCHIP